MWMGQKCLTLTFSWMVLPKTLGFECFSTLTFILRSFLFYVVFTPSPPSHHGSVWVLPVISLFLTSTVLPVQACLTKWWERFRGTQKGEECWPLLLVLNHLWCDPINVVMYMINVYAVHFPQLKKSGWNSLCVLQGLVCVIQFIVRYIVEPSHMFPYCSRAMSVGTVPSPNF